MTPVWRAVCLPVITAALFTQMLSICSCGRANADAAADRMKMRIDGSSTAYPIMSALADDFHRANPGADITVNKSGTGSGMQKFERGEIDIAAASRPILPSEAEALRRAGVEFIEVPIAYDGVSVIVSLRNPFVRSMSLGDLRRAWRVDSPVRFWSDIDRSWPHERVDFYGPTDNHGTYDYFADAIKSKDGAMRTDVQMNQEYNAIVQAVADDPAGIGYVGLSYYADNRDKVRAIGIDSGSGAIAPSQESVADGTYRELSRPLFLYVGRRAMEAHPVIRDFVEFALSAKGSSDVAEAHYVPLPVQALSVVKQRFEAQRTGSLFVHEAPTISVADMMQREAAGR